MIYIHGFIFLVYIFLDLYSWFYIPGFIFVVWGCFGSLGLASRPRPGLIFLALYSWFYTFCIPGFIFLCIYSWFYIPGFILLVYIPGFRLSVLSSPQHTHQNDVHVSEYWKCVFFGTFPGACSQVHSIRIKMYPMSQRNWKYVFFGKSRRQGLSCPQHTHQNAVSQKHWTFYFVLQIQTPGEPADGILGEPVRGGFTLPGIKDID